MLMDQALASAVRARTAYDHGTEILLDAWSGAAPARRAAMFAAKGDIARAGLHGGAGWKQLASQDVIGALRTARGHKSRGASMTLLEAEALIAAGAVVAGLKRLHALHRRGDTAGTLALARRLHLLGDHDGAQRAAEALPMHAQAALIGARASVAKDRIEVALRFLAPYLEGIASIPEPAVAGAIAVIAASALARSGRSTQLKRFAHRLLGTTDLPQDMMPMIARIAWIAGLASQAWDRFGDKGGNHPWMAAARLELAFLAGNAALASQLLRRAGPIGVPGAAALFFLEGGNEPPVHGAEVENLFAEGAVVHVWRAHPHRWQPWIDAALRTPADVAVFDLAEGKLPDEETIPRAVFDDGSLIEYFSPVSVAARPVRGTGVWIKEPLCHGVGIGHDWPEGETRFMEDNMPLASSRRSAAVQVLGAEAALSRVHEGRPMVVVAPPGDCFWAGSFPERAWPALRIVRADPKTGWRGAGARIAEHANALLAGSG